MFLYVSNKQTNDMHAMRVLSEIKGREILQSLVTDNSNSYLYQSLNGFLNLDKSLSLQGVTNGEVLTSSWTLYNEL